MALAAALCASLTGVAVAATPAITQVITSRQSNLKDMGGSFKVINDQLKKDSPNMSEVRTAANDVKQFSNDLAKWFPKGSGPEAGVKTRAKADIWAKNKDFVSAAQKFQVEAGKLAAAAAGSDIDALKAQAKATGATCGGCHDPFREKQS